jgi:YHS domain-containing protein
MISKMIMMVCVLALPLPAFADHHEGGEAVKAEEKVQAPVEVGNKICPVSGEEVGKMGDVVKFEHNGKIYNFCCAMCIKDFKKDPEKYSKIAEDEVAQAADVPSGS